jgi:hypothetical protein
MLYRTVVMATCIRACALPAACRLASGHGHYCVRKCLPQGVRMCSNGFARFHSAKSNLSFTRSRAVVVPATSRRLVTPPLFFVPRRAAVRLLTTASSATDLEQAASGVAPQDSFPPHDPRVPVTIITGFLGSGKVCSRIHPALCLEFPNSNSDSISIAVEILSCTPIASSLGRSVNACDADNTLESCAQRTAWETHCCHRE